MWNTVQLVTMMKFISFVNISVKVLVFCHDIVSCLHCTLSLEMSFIYSFLSVYLCLRLLFQVVMIVSAVKHLIERMLY